MKLNELLSLTAHRPFDAVEWPGAGKFTVRIITAGERIELIQRVQELKESTRPMPMLSTYAALFLGDENGKRIISNEEIERAEELPNTLVERLVEIGLELNGLSKKSEPKKN